MGKEDAVEKLRDMAMRLLDSSEGSVLQNTYGNNIKDLLQELNIYHIELEHQNMELERSEKELASSKSEYEDLFENAPVGYVIIDKTGRIYRMNKTFIRYYVSLDKQDYTFSGQDFDQFICPEFQSAFHLYCSKFGLSNVKIPVPLELKIYNRYNTPQYVMIINNPLEVVNLSALSNPLGFAQSVNRISAHNTANSDGNGSEVADKVEEKQLYRLAISDIQMQKKFEMQLLYARDKAEANDREKSRFLTNLSHDIRTPLTTILGFISLLDDPTLSFATRKEYFDSIKLSAAILQSLVDEILDLSTLESGIIPLRNENVDVNAICSELVALTQCSIRNKNVLIRADIDDIPILWADPIRLRQIISCILEHTAENASSGTIVLGARYVQIDMFQGALYLEFTGDNIFSAENSLDVGHRRKPVSQNCAGLGLYLAQQIVKFMGATMTWVHPLDSLRIEIPLEKSRRISPAIDKKSIDGSNDLFPRRTCLLVDDVVMNLKVLGAIMKLMNCVPTLASSAAEALEILKKDQKKFDFIMTDLWMPNMNGEEFALEIRQDARFNSVPLYAVTADVERERTFNMSFFANTVIKPVTKEKIRRIIVSLPDPQEEAPDWVSNEQSASEESGDQSTENNYAQPTDEEIGQ